MHAGSGHLTFSSNGNAISRNGKTIAWTSYNYPSGVGTATESATFDYGPDRQRWRMIYTGSAGVETTYYATPMFEVVHTSSATDYRHYMFAGGRAVMQLSRSSTGAAQRPLLTDHQGSISTIMHGTGTSFVNESFTAYGNRREASTWSGVPTSTELTNMASITRQGYTFQTVLGSMGLNHMNGRVEDSVTGRFLSPDPRGTQRGKTQSWNRYSYVNNNPLSFTDPTGFAVCNGKFGDKPGCIIGEPSDHWSNIDFGPSGAPLSISGVDMDDGATDMVSYQQSQEGGGSVTGNTDYTVNEDEPGSQTAPGPTADAKAPDSAAQSQIPPSIALAPSAGFVADAGTVTGIGLGTIIATAVVGAIGVLLPDSTASDDTTSDNSNVPVYRVVSPAELAYLQANGNYGSSPSQGGKYFALTAAGAQAFLSAPMNSDGTLTMTTLPGSVLSQGRAFPDIGPNGAGPSVWFSNPQLPLVYGTMTPPVVIPGN